MTRATETLLDYFSPLDDPRIERNKHHLLLDIIVIAICGVLCGADNWVEVENFGRAKQRGLQQFLTLPNGIPSHIGPHHQDV